MRTEFFAQRKFSCTSVAFMCNPCAHGQDHATEVQREGIQESLKCHRYIAHPFDFFEFIGVMCIDRSLVVISHGKKMVRTARSICKEYDSNRSSP